jgi:hypothetical protein
MKPLTAAEILAGYAAAVRDRIGCKHPDNPREIKRLEQNEEAWLALADEHGLNVLVSKVYRETRMAFAREQVEQYERAKGKQC